VFTSSVTIEEVTAAPGKRARSILLTGSGLPYVGTPWGTNLAVTTTWYPGNADEADQQVVGPQELPATWSGGWHRTMLGRTPAKLVDSSGARLTVSAPSDLANFFEGMQRAGRRLRVTWASDQAPSNGAGGTLDTSVTISLKIVREGRCKKFEYRPHTVHDFDWAMEWDWLGRGKSTQNVTSTRSGVLTQLGAAYESAIQAILDAANAAQAAKFAPTAITIGQLAALANTPSLAVASALRSVTQLQNELGQIVGIAKTLQSQPASVANMAINHARNTQAQAKAIYREFSSQGVETLSKKGDAASVLAAHSSFGPVQDDCLLGARAAKSFEAEVRKSATVAQQWLGGEKSLAQQPSANTILTVVTAKDGDTPKAMSQRWYGTPDHDVDILRANGLSWYLPRFAKGQRVVIPVISAATSSTAV
jgi:hypothetical protein